MWQCLRLQSFVRVKDQHPMWKKTFDRIKDQHQIWAMENYLISIDRIHNSEALPNADESPKI